MTTQTVIRDENGAMITVASLARPAAVEDVAKTFRRRLHPDERLTLARAAMASLDPDSRNAIMREAERFRRSEDVFHRARTELGGRW